MQVTVSRRIGGGYALLILLLLLIGTSAYISLQRIDEQVRVATHEAAPRVVQSGHLINLLGDAENLMLRYRMAARTEGLDIMEQELDQLRARFARQWRAMQGLLGDSAGAGGELDERMETLFATGKQLFAAHRGYLYARNAVQMQQAAFVTAAKDLRFESKDIADFVTDFDTSDSARFIHDEMNYIARMVEDMLALADVEKVARMRQQIASRLTFTDKKLGVIQQRAPDNYADLVEPYRAFTAQLSEPGLLVASHARAVQQRALEARLQSQLAEQAQINRRALRQLEQQATELSGQARSVAERTVKTSVLLIIGCSVLALVLGVVLSWLIVGSIRKPLQATVQGINALAAGDLTCRLSHARCDEFGELAGSVNHMAQSLRELILRIRASGETLNHSAEDSLTVCEQTRVGTVEQGRQTAQVADGMAQMEAAVTEVAGHAERTLQEVEAAQHALVQGRETLDINLATFERLARQVSEAADVIEHLESYSAQIGNVLDVIREIAEQTNLLALNAAIEAARAGEQGRGFAVVADEVRSLASRTQNSTGEIEEIIHNLQSGAQNSVRLIVAGRSEAEQCAGQSRDSGASLDQLMTAMESIRGMSAQIAAAIDEQRVTAQEVAHTVSGINTVATQTATGAEQTAEQSQAVISASRQLQALIERFKV